MSESVEQAALARAERDALPAPWGSVLDAMEALSRLNDGRFKLMQAITSRHDDELAEIRDAILALTNRVEAVAREAAPQLGFTQRTDAQGLPALGTAEAERCGVREAAPSFRDTHLLAQDCLACNREQGMTMCKLCSDLEDAEAAVTDDERRRDDPTE